jgi:hypothetical protein
MRYQETLAACLVLLLTLFFLGACTHAKIYATTGNKVSFTETDPAGGESFKVMKRITFDYTAALDVQEVLREHYGSGNEFQNVTVKLKTEVDDYFINLITFGTAKSKTFEITGDKVR